MFPETSWESLTNNGVILRNFESNKAHKKIISIEFVTTKRDWDKIILVGMFHTIH